MMKRLVAFTFLLCLFLAATLVLAPGFVDWNRHKDSVAAHLSGLLQRDVGIGGNIRFAVLPQPRFYLEDVTLGGMAAGDEPLARIGRLDMRVRVMPLLEGRVDVESVALHAPDVRFVLSAEGKGNWEGLFRPVKLPVRLEDVQVTDGRFSMADAVTGRGYVVEDIDAVIAAESLQGPYDVRGTAVYQGVQGRVGVRTALRRPDRGLPLSLSFTTDAAGQPSFDFDGEMGFGGAETAGLGVTGVVNVKGASPAVLLGGAFLRDLPVMAQIKNFSAQAEISVGHADLREIVAETAQGGKVEGAFGWRYARGGDQPAAVTADLRATRLSVAGVAFDKLNLNAARDAKGVWTVEALEMAFADSAARLSGIMTPDKGTAMLGMTVQSGDVSAGLKALNLPENSPLSVLATSGLLKAAVISADIDMQPDKIVLEDLKLSLLGKQTVRGKLEMPRASMRPFIEADLDFENFDATSLDDTAWRRFLASFEKVESGLSLRFENLTWRDGVVFPKADILASVDEKGVTLTRLNAQTRLGDENTPAEGLEIKGRVDSLVVPKVFDMGYHARLADAAVLAGFAGWRLPPPVARWENTDVRGTFSGAADDYKIALTGTVDRIDVDIKGRYHNGAYALSAVVQQAGETQNAPPVTPLSLERLLHAGGGMYRLSGTVAGASSDSFEMTGINTALNDMAVAGRLAYKNGAERAALAVEHLDMDRFAWRDWAVAGAEINANISARAMAWKGIAVLDAKAHMLAQPNRVTLSQVTGDLWGGTLTGALTATGSAEKDAWQTGFKGTLMQADLDQLAAHLGLSAVALGRGDAVFDLSAAGKGVLRDLRQVSGTVTIKPAHLEMDRFNVAAALAALKGVDTPVSDLQQLVNHALTEKGRGAYIAPELVFALENGVARLADVVLDGAGFSVKAGATLDIAQGVYDVAASVAAKGQTDMPAFHVARKDRLSARAGGNYAVDLGAVEKWLATRGRETAPDSPATPSTTIDGVLQRLNDE